MKQGLLTAFCFLVVSACSDRASDVTETRDKTVDQAAWAQACEAWDEWDKAGPAYQIHGNTYYVGTCGIASILIAGTDGHILIDGGTEAGAAIISDNIASLGFDISDVKILLHSHEHFDHVAGLADLQRLSGAKLIASKSAGPVLSTGRIGPSDPQFGMHEPFPPAEVTRILKENEIVDLGDLSLMAIETPGHSKGALSWQWESCEADACEYIVYADSLSPIGRDDYKFSEHLVYLENYWLGLGKLADLDCTLLVTPHPSASKMRTRIMEDVLSSPEGCKHYSESISKRLQKRLDKEQAKALP